MASPATSGFGSLGDRQTSQREERRDPHSFELSVASARGALGAPQGASTTSPTRMPTRYSMRFSGGTSVLRSMRPFCISTAQRTASTTLRNSMMLPSPVRLTIRP
jgi:hypothetical protein